MEPDFWDIWDTSGAEDADAVVVFLGDLEPGKGHFQRLIGCLLSKVWNSRLSSIPNITYLAFGDRTTLNADRVRMFPHLY